MKKLFQNKRIELWWDKEMGWRMGRVIKYSSTVYLLGWFTLYVFH